ncbi:MAG: N-acetylmuramoyl-L-alanine amidase [Prevotella sp.]|nr:N-acetylmuramoyl-L-alanine amidase [Prevotella sp.]
MRKITLIIIHCSATRADHSYTFEDCRNDHIRHRHFKDIGYHYYITRDGSIHKGRPEEQVGAHCRHHNRYSIGICYEGGLDTKGKAADTRTPAQRAALHALVHSLRRDYPQALVVGHHTLDPHKDCPCFDVKDL